MSEELIKRLRLKAEVLSGLRDATASLLTQAADALSRAPAVQVPDVLTFDALRAANVERIGSSKYRKCEESWTPAHWMQATMGELGELANLLKKVDRGDFPFEQVKADIARELADVQCYLDILALKLGVNLGQATIDKFNEVSVRIGSHVRLAAAPSAPVAGVDVEKVMALVEQYGAANARFGNGFGAAAANEAVAILSELRALLASAPAVPVGDDGVVIPAEALRWLFGVGRDAFAEPANAIGKFWWRRVFADKAGIDIMSLIPPAPAATKKDDRHE